MNLRGAICVLVAPALLAGCSLMGIGPGAGVDGLLRQASRSVKATVEVNARVPLESGGEMAIFSYRRGKTCGAGFVDGASETIVTQEGPCSDPIAPGQSASDTFTVVYGYLPPLDVGKIILRWEDGTEAEAALGKSAFYYVAEGADRPQGQVSLTAYDRQGNVIHETPPPGEQHHHHGGR